MPAPTLGDSYLVISAPLSSGTNPAEDTSKLDPNFATAWNATKWLSPNRWQGDTDVIAFAAALCYRFKSGTGVLTPTLSSISPTTIARNTAFTLTCNGTNFDAGAKVEVTLGTKTTIFTAATSTNIVITVSIPATGVLTAAGTATVLVRNLNGVASASQNLTVT